MSEIVFIRNAKTFFRCLCDEGLLSHNPAQELRWFMSVHFIDYLTLLPPLNTRMLPEGVKWALPRATTLPPAHKGDMPGVTEEKPFLPLRGRKGLVIT